jgi:uncharacterized membrane protein
MGKLDYLDALKRAMQGLPPQTQARTLAYYEQRFVDAAALGHSEQDVARQLDDPRKIAMTLRANAHLDALQQTNHRVTLPRLLLTGAGLAIFNLFMVVPAALCAALLTALYACALAFYVGGIAITASGLAGANELLLNLPKVVILDDSDPAQTRVSIGDSGVEVYQERANAARPWTRRRRRACCAQRRRWPAARSIFRPGSTPARAPPRPCSAWAWCWVEWCCSCSPWPRRATPSSASGATSG